MLFPILRSNNLPIVVVQPDERHANKTASVLRSGLKDTFEHTISCLHEDNTNLFLIGCFYDLNLLYQITFFSFYKN